MARNPLETWQSSGGLLKGYESPGLSCTEFTDPSFRGSGLGRLALRRKKKKPLHLLAAFRLKHPAVGLGGKPGGAGRLGPLQKIYLWPSSSR
jgi:hypothetical protein